MTNSKIDRPFPDDETLRGTLQAGFSAIAGPAGIEEPDWEPLELGVEEAFEGLERAGATRETAYDDEYRATRDAALAREGYRVMRIQPE